MTRVLHRGYELVGLFASIQSLMELAILGDAHRHRSRAGMKMLELMLPRLRDDERETLVAELLTDGGSPEHQIALQSFKDLKQLRDLLGHGIPYAENEETLAILKLGGRGYVARVEVLTRADLDDALARAEDLRSVLADFVSKQGWSETPVHRAIRNLQGQGRAGDSGILPD